MVKEGQMPYECYEKIKIWKYRNINYKYKV